MIDQPCRMSDKKDNTLFESVALTTQPRCLKDLLTVPLLKKGFFTCVVSSIGVLRLLCWFCGNGTYSKEFLLVSHGVHRDCNGLPQFRKVNDSGLNGIDEKPWPQVVLPRTEPI